MANATILCNPITDLNDPAWLKFVPETPRAWEHPGSISRTERAKAISPLSNVTSRSAPSLVVHGLKDRVVDADLHSVRFQKTMESAGVRCELLLLPDATHAFIVPGYKNGYAEWATAMRASDDFLVSLGYLKGSSPLVVLPAEQSGRRRLVARWKLDAAPAEGGFFLDESGKLKLTAGRSSVGLVADTERGKVLKVKGDPEGLSGDCFVMGMTSTLSLWLKPSQRKGILVSRRSSGGSDYWGYSLELEPSGTLSLKLGDLKVYQDAGAQKVQSGQWNHLEAVIGRERAEVYLNSKRVAVLSYPPRTFHGNRLAIAGGYEGLLSDLQLFKGTGSPGSPQ